MLKKFIIFFIKKLILFFLTKFNVKLFTYIILFHIIVIHYIFIIAALRLVLIRLHHRCTPIVIGVFFFLTKFNVTLWSIPE